MKATLKAQIQAEMKEAYALSALTEKLKEKGLELAEEAVGDVYVAVKEWIMESAKKSSTPFDDLIVQFFPQIDAVIMPQIGKIDGK